jgi:CRP-like cAMP-binding protein
MAADVASCSPAVSRPPPGLFAALSDADWQALIAKGRACRYEARRTIFQKGDEGGFMLLVRSGCIRVAVYADDGREAVLNLIEPGGLVGEVALLDGRRRTADVVAASRVEALMITRADVLALIAERPAVAMTLMEALCEKLRRTTHQVEALALRDLPGRLALLLLRLGEERGHRVPAGLRIARPPPQGDIARLIGSTRESVNRQLRAWARLGLIACTAGAIVLRQPATLEEIAR